MTAAKAARELLGMRNSKLHGRLQFDSMTPLGSNFHKPQPHGAHCSWSTLLMEHTAHGAHCSWGTNTSSCIGYRYYRKPGFLYSTRSPMRSLVFIAMKHIREQFLHAQLGLDAFTTLLPHANVSSILSIQ